jgi:cell division protein FtsQ
VSRTELQTPIARSWRDIPQQVKPRAMSTEGRRRMFVGVGKTTIAFVALSALVWAGVEIASALDGDPKRLTSKTESPPVKEVVLVTDGVLDQRWLVATLAIPAKSTLMDLDLFQLRGRLLASGQVLSATLTRNFPATLTVRLTERTPVARARVQDGTGAPQTLLVARDGVVFEGVSFDSSMLNSLPWLDGVKLVRQGDRFAPIDGMDSVSDLLAKAKLEADHLYRSWQVVSLARLQSDGEIQVRANGIANIRFSVTDDYFRQLARLDALLDTIRARTDQPIREMNLAIGAQVPVAFEDPALTPQNKIQPGAHPGAGSTAAPLPTFPASLQRTKP